MPVFIAVYLVLLLFTGVFAPVPCAGAFTDGVWTYTVADSNPTITGYAGVGGAVAIPGSLGTSPAYPVTSIGPYAFYVCTKPTTVTFPSAATAIGDHGFKDCVRLAAGCFLGNAPGLGTDVFTSCAAGFVVWRLSSKTGWTNPRHTYPTVVMAATPGDVNLDCSVSMLDTSLATRAAVGSMVLTGSAFQAADVNHDGTITMLDVLLITRLAAGIPVFSAATACRTAQQPWRGRSACGRAGVRLSTRDSGR